MPWWGWLILGINIVIIFWVARKRANHMIDDYRNPDNEIYALAAALGLINGFLWPLFLLGILFIFIFFPSKALDFLQPFKPKFLLPNEEEEDDRTDEEVRKEVERLRREYTMPKWKRFILRIIHV